MTITRPREAGHRLLAVLCGTCLALVVVCGVLAWQLAHAEAALVPTVVVSACEPDELSRAQLRPAAWLEKPFRIDALLAVVKRHVVPEWTDEDP